MALGIGLGDAVDHDRLYFFATARLHRARRRDADFCRYRPGDFQHFAARRLRASWKVCRRNASGQLVDSAGRIVRAIIPVHLFGLCCEMEEINQLGRQYELMVIEDAAQAIGAEYPAKDGGVARPAR